MCGKRPRLSLHRSSGQWGGRGGTAIAERLAVSSLDISENVGTIHEFYSKNGLFGWCYAIDGGYKGCNPYIDSCPYRPALHLSCGTGLPVSQREALLFLKEKRSGQPALVTSSAVWPPKKQLIALPLSYIPLCAPRESNPGRKNGNLA